MANLATRFRDIIATLRAALARQVSRDRAQQSSRDHARAAVLTLVEGHFGRMAMRLHKLFIRWQAGTLPKPRPSRAGQTRTSRAQPGLPAGRAWLLRLVPQGAASGDPTEAAGSLRLSAATAGAQMQHLLAQPDMAAFLAAAPQAGRILRPLCRMLGVAAAPEIPAELNLPPPAKFRPAPPPPAPHLGIIEPPEVQPHHTSLPRNRAGRAWYQ